tara:strand:+ start:660 stop:1646 length:987 start_codon:yes stop_codon:yes gene_type:complete
MEYRDIPGIKIPMSQVIQGATTLFGEESVEHWEDLLDDVMNSGINAFDTGLVYADQNGNCDERLGRWINARNIRDQVIVIGKGCHPGPPNWEESRVLPECVELDIEKTLDRMGTDRLDLWLFHRDDEEIPIDELVDAVDKQISAGLISSWGVSNWSINRLESALESAKKNSWVLPVVFSPHLSLVSQEQPPWKAVTSIAGDAANDDREWLKDKQFQVLAWSTLAGGYLTSSIDIETMLAPSSHLLAEMARCYHSEKNWSRRERAIELAIKKDCTLEQIAVSWVLHADFPTYALCASRNKTEASHNVASAEIYLSASERIWLESGEIIE